MFQWACATCNLPTGRSDKTWICLLQPEALIQHLTEMGRLDRRVSSPSSQLHGDVRAGVVHHEFCCAGPNQFSSSLKIGLLLSEILLPSTLLNLTTMLRG